MNNEQQDIHPTKKKEIIIPKGKTRVGKCSWCGKHALLYNMGAYDFCLECVIATQQQDKIPEDRVNLRLHEGSPKNYDKRGTRGYYDNGTSSIVIQNHKNDTPYETVLFISHESIHYTLHHIGLMIESYQFDRLAYNTWDTEISHGYILTKEDQEFFLKEVK